MKPFEWKPGRHQMSGEVNALLDHTVGPSDYHRNDRLRQQILKHFQLNPKDTEARRNLERLNSDKPSPVSRPTSGN